MPTSTAAPPTITSTRPGSRPGLCARCAADSVASGAEHVLGGVAREHEVVDLLGVVLGEAQLDRGDGGDGPGEPDQRRAPRPRRGPRAGTSATRSRTTATAFDSSSGAGGSECEELLGDAHAPDVERHQADGLVGAEHELGGATADVDHEVGRRRVEVGGGAEERQRRLLLPGQQLGSDARARRARRRRTRRGSVASRAALVAVARTRVTPCSSSAARYSRSTATVRSIASGASARVRSTPWPRRVMRMRRSSGHELGVAWRRAVDLGDEQAHRVRADVDRGDPAHRSLRGAWVAHAVSGQSADASCAAVQRPTGSSPPASRCA